MRVVGAQLSAHLASGVTTIATCWKVTRQDNTVMGFTDHSENITFDSVLYKAATGFTPTSIQNKADFSVDNMELEGLLDSADITEADIMAGKYDFAAVEVFVVNYTDSDQGRMILKTGRTGELFVSKNQFHAELRGLAQHLSQTVTEVYSPNCRAILGDSKCKVALAGFTASSSVTAVTDNLTFTASGLSQADGWFTGGEIQWLTGNNSGARMEIKEFAAGVVVLALPMAGTIQVGDTFDAIAGCDKTLDTCVAKFSNAINFRGEPHVPGMDKLLETGSTIER